MRLIDIGAYFENSELMNTEFPMDSVEHGILYDVANELEFAPCIDAEPVRHGHWVELWFDEEDRLFGELPSDYKCSVCGGIVPRKTFQSGHYCPNCGAKMDEVSE